jgi:uncharacterized protein (DUF1786 family)
MGQFLMIDIGAGTMDILWYDSDSGRSFKIVTRSPVWRVAEMAAGEGDLVVTGGEMGGGPVSATLESRARRHRVSITPEAAHTLNHDPQKVAAMGLEIVDRQAADRLIASGTPSITLADIDGGQIRRIAETLDVPFAFDAVAVCAQDHGMPPEGVSHLDYRHRCHSAALDADPSPAALLYPADQIPESFNRLRTIATDAARLPARAVYVMDSGMAAILGASLDPLASVNRDAMVLDIATSHTVAATLHRGEVAAYLEYHTRDLSADLLEALLPSLAEGRLTHDEVLAGGGHGAYTRRRVGFNRLGVIVATGPRRALVRRSTLPLVFGAPFGDNMMTGTTGLLEALRRRLGLAPIDYI